MTCEFGEDLVREGMRAMNEAQERGVELSFRGGKWSCGLGGASDPFSCVNTADSAARAEWGQE